MWDNRPVFTHICVPCRFTSKHTGSCPLCAEKMRPMYNFQPPKKHDDKGWKKVELLILANESGIQLCDWACCVSIRGENFNKLTLSQYRARIRKRRTHRQGSVPKKYNYRIGMWRS